MKLVLILLSVAALLNGCSSIHTDRDPRTDLNGFKRYFVLHRLTDDHHIDEMIVAQLNSFGFEASSGPMTMMPQSADALVIYTDEWAWDFKSYLIRLDVEIHRSHNNQRVARGTYEQPSMFTKSPEKVIEKILTPLFHPR